MTVKRDPKPFRELHPVAKVAIALILTAAGLIAVGVLGLLAKGVWNVISWAWS